MHKLTIGLFVAVNAILANAATLKSGWVSDGAQIWRVEIADTDATRAKGLMYRPYLLPQSGMLFIFEHPRAVSFWMKNTWLPLDMRFYDAHGKLVNHFPNAIPCSSSPCPVYPSTEPVKYVLETATSHSLTPRAKNLSLIAINEDNAVYQFATSH